MQKAGRVIVNWLTECQVTGGEPPMTIMYDDDS